MKRVLTDTEMLYVRSMGKLLRVTAIVTTVEEANARSARKDDEGVVAEFGPFILFANLYDPGTKVAPDPPTHPRILTRF